MRFTNFPIRDGVATGHANERQMLDIVGDDIDSFRTQIRDNGDGTTTRLRTKGGSPEFVTSADINKNGATSARTFVFSPRSDLTKGVIANLTKTGSFDIRDANYVTTPRVAYGVQPPISTNRDSWETVIRLEEDYSLVSKPKVNGESLQPEEITQAADTCPSTGLPHVFITDHLLAGYSRISFGLIDASNYTVSTEYVMGVVAVGLDGNPSYFTSAIIDDQSDAQIFQFRRSGIHLVPQPDGTAIYNFYWQGPDISTGGLVTDFVSCHTAIKVHPVGVPYVVSSDKTVTRISPYTFHSVNYSASTDAQINTQIGTYKTWMRKNFSGEHGEVNVYGAAPYTYMNELAGEGTAWTGETTARWSKSINFEDSYTLGAGAGELVIHRSVTGSEAESIRSGALTDTSFFTHKYFVGTEGQDQRWSRHSETRIDVKHSHSGNSIFKVDVTWDSSLVYDLGVRVPTATWDYSSIADYLATPQNVGSNYPYLQNATPDINAAIQARVQEIIDADNAYWQYFYEVEHVGTAASFGITSNPVITRTEAKDDRYRDDAITLSVQTRDFIFYDPEEEISLSLVCVVDHQRGDHSSPPISEFNVPTYWDTGYCTLTIQYELNIRGQIKIFPVYENTNCWWPSLNMGPVSEPGYDANSWNKTFSGAILPETIEPYNNPAFMNQGACPWIGYTTKNEEANGAVPQFFIDVSIIPTQAVGSGSSDYQADPFYFYAIQMQTLFAEFMGTHAPVGVMDTIFHEPTRINFARNKESPWQDDLGSDFSGFAKLTVSRI